MLTCPSLTEHLTLGHSEVDVASRACQPLLALTLGPWATDIITEVGGGLEGAHFVGYHSLSTSSRPDPLLGTSICNSGASLRPHHGPSMGTIASVGHMQKGAQKGEVPCFRSHS